MSSMVGVAWQSPDTLKELPPGTDVSLGDELVASLAEGMAILRGEVAPARFYPAPPVLTKREMLLRLHELQRVQAQAQRTEPRYQQDERVGAVVGFNTADGFVPVAPPKPRELLMSADNPQGWKLEELVGQLRHEIAAKNAKLSASAEHPVDAAGTHKMLVRGTVRELNGRIMALLMQVDMIQREIMAELRALGPDQGPLGTPRV